MNIPCIHFYRLDLIPLIFFCFHAKNLSLFFPVYVTATILRYSRRWRLPWSRSRGPAPSPDSNYGFHTQARLAEANAADSSMGPYSVLNSQNAGPYSALQSVNHNRQYSTTAASGPYSVLDGPVPLWGPPPPYSDPNSPARRPGGLVQVPVPESRPRISKRVQENFEANEGESLIR